MGDAPELMRLLISSGVLERLGGVGAGDGLDVVVAPPLPDTAPPDAEPPDTGPVDTQPPPQAITVTVDTAALQYMVAASWDGSESYLVPVYQFRGTGTDGNRYDVAALAIDGSFLAPPEDPGIRGTIDTTNSDGIPTPPDPCVFGEDDGSGTTITAIAGCNPTETKPGGE
jgi:hypothetical protein